jgi:hypothetical protein
MTGMFFRILSIVTVLVLLVGCSVPEFYLDIHYPSEVNANGKLPIDVFITNSRLGTIVHIESIRLTGELATISQMIEGRNGLYEKSADGNFYAEPNRNLIQFETGAFSLTIRPLRSGDYVGTFVFNIDGSEFTREVSVTVR